MGLTFTGLPFVSGLLSLPVNPSMRGSLAFNPPSMWSKLRFSIIRQTTCFKASIPGGMYFMTPFGIAAKHLFYCFIILLVVGASGRGLLRRLVVGSEFREPILDIRHCQRLRRKDLR